jgi:hypothetical protein
MRHFVGVVLVVSLAMTACRPADGPAAPPREIVVAVTPSASPSNSGEAVTPPTAEQGRAPRADPQAQRCDRMRLVITSAVQHGYTQFTGTLFNDGTKVVSLVEPGDGSESGWRTPTVSWTVKTMSGQPVTQQRGARCGNVNPLHESEIFDLPPGAKHVMTPWFGSPDVPAGKYVVRATYENDPKAKMHGLALGMHDEKALELVRQSTACRVESNALTVDIVQP